MGPAESGKTTTLYAALKQVNTSEHKILTIEDPIEDILPGIIQVKAQPEIGLSFHNALSAFLRHDPDIIVLGEIRDRETAQLAVEASLTGHLVLSTLRIQDTSSAIMRFLEMNLPPFMVSSALMMVCAQRLIQRLCPHCKESYEATHTQKQQLKVNLQQTVKLYRSRGCPQCSMKGYQGRMGVFEILVPSDRVRDTINQKNCTVEMIRRIAINSGQMTTIYQEAISKVLAGETSLEELNNKFLDADRN